jgi:protease-4
MGNIRYTYFMPEEKNSGSTSKFLIVIVFVLLFVLVIDGIGRNLNYFEHNSLMSEGESEEAGFGPECNVAGLTFEGELLTYPIDDPAYTDVDSADSIIYELETAEADPNIEVILLEIDSPGGSPVAAQEITDTIKKTITKPVIVRIRGIGASAGYWVASAADRIFASKMSDIGSIGITMSYLDEALLNEQSGYTYNEINSGKYKDSGSSQKELTAEERALFQRDVDIMYQIFIDEIAQNRNLSQEEVKALADGATMLGEMAKEKGLIDEVGMHSDVLNYIKETYQIEPNVCWL